MNGISTLRDAVQNKSLPKLTEALSELADELAYQLKPPYTEILRLMAKEEAGRFEVDFAARLHLHYSSLSTSQEGLVFTIQFGGEAFADSPNPPIHELFYAAIVESIHVCGYGSKWKGRAIKTPQEIAKNLEVTSQTLDEFTMDDFYRMLEGRK